METAALTSLTRSQLRDHVEAVGPHGVPPAPAAAEAAPPALTVPGGEGDEAA